MKKLTINKMNEYPAISLDEQMTLKGGDGYGSESNPIQLPEVVVYGKSENHWNREGKYDMNGCPSCMYGRLAKPDLGDPKLGVYFGQLINHYFNHKESYYGDGRSK